MNKFIVYYRLNRSFVNHRRAEIIWMHTKQPVDYAAAVKLVDTLYGTGYDAYIMVAEDSAPVFKSPVVYIAA